MDHDHFRRRLGGGFYDDGIDCPYDPTYAYTLSNTCSY
jgi:hypothetical protein